MTPCHLALAGGLLFAPAVFAAPVDCFGPGTAALTRGRGGPALAAFQAAFGHPDCRHHRGGLMLNMGAAFDLLAQETGDPRFACAAAVRYRAVLDEPATPRMLVAAERGARAADARCGERNTKNAMMRGEMGLDEIVDHSSTTVLATTVTIGAVTALVGGGVFLALAADDDERYQEAIGRLGRTTDPADADRELRAAGEAYGALKRDEVLSVTLLGVGGALALVSIWAWIDLSNSGLAAAPSPGGAVISGVW